MLIDGALSFTGASSDSPPFSAAQTIYTGSASSTNVVDLVVNNDPGIGMAELDFAIYVSTAFAISSGAPTLTVQVMGATSAQGAGGTYNIITQTDAYVAANLTKNALIPLTLTRRSLVQVATMYRFLKLYFLIGGTGSFSAGAVTAQLVIDRDTGDTMGQYKNNYTVAS